MTTTMNNEQFELYNSFLKRIDATLEETVSSVGISPMNKLKDTLYNNGEIWKQIQLDIFDTILPREIKNKLSLHCDDVARKYFKKVEELLNS